MPVAFDLTGDFVRLHSGIELAAAASEATFKNCFRVICRPNIVALIVRRVLGGLTLAAVFLGPWVRADDVAFFFALNADYQALRAECTVVREPIKVGAHTIQTLSAGKHRIFAIKMGSGAVETAASAQALLARFRCDFGISLGPVGALTADLRTGSWCRVGSVCAYQQGAWTTSGFRIPDAATRILTNDAAANFVIPKLFVDAKTISVASGEIFVNSDAYRKQLHGETSADAVDMNLLGLVSVCREYRLPMVHWRIVSDNADDNAGDEFRKFSEVYDGSGGKAVAELIRALPPNPNSPQTYPALQKLLRPNEKSDKN